MVFVLLLAVAVHTGGAPSDWQQVPEIGTLEYRWSLPYSNACKVEFSSKDTGEQQYEIAARILSTRPAPEVEKNPDNPMHIKPTKIRPQTDERVFSIQLPPSGRTSETIHDCYGVQSLHPEIGHSGAGSAPDTSPYSSPK
jgi:hypothetical protein